MADTQPATPAPSLGAAEFRCTACGTVAKVVRDWGRCYLCTLAATQRNTVTYPGLCQPCHTVKHPKAQDYI